MKMQEELGDDIQILLVESQGHTLDDAEKLAYQKKWINDRSIWTTERPFETGAKGIPNYALLSNDGTILSMGNPGSDHSKIVDQITEQLKLAKKGAKGMGPTAVKANAEFEKGNFSAAIKLLDAAPEAEKAEADKLRHSLETRAKAKVARLDWYIGAGEYDKADKLLPTLQKGMAGDEKLEASVKTCSDKLSSKELAQEREASKALAKVQKLIQGDGIGDVAVKQLNAVATKYPNTRAAKKASHLVDLSK
ncbi:MAG TPA: hypothetical protein VFG37_09035 [Planctomycetota bacterium]|nr:hypothetical protein [Planctomycetota bacterium]